MATCTAPQLSQVSPAPNVLVQQKVVKSVYVTLNDLVYVQLFHAPRGQRQAFHPYTFFVSLSARPCPHSVTMLPPDKRYATFQKALLVGIDGESLANVTSFEQVKKHYSTLTELGEPIELQLVLPPDYAAALNAPAAPLEGGGALQTAARGWQEGDPRPSIPMAAFAASVV